MVIEKSRLLDSCSEMNRLSKRLRAQSGPSNKPFVIGLVPTMGALHAGHLSLVKASLKQAEHTIVSVFVNPTQFSPDEDLDKYPRQLQRDLDLLDSVGPLHVFAPTAKEMYPAGCATRVQPHPLATRLEGQFRPTHFQGVATVVLKLLNVTQPDVAFFGQKDYQQTLVIRHMIRDLNLPAEIAVCPIVRDEQGLALSSRNRFLSPDERVQALALPRALAKAKKLIAQGESNPHQVELAMRATLQNANIDQIDYAAVVNAETLETNHPIQMPAVCLIAANVGKTRLIDNEVLV